MSMIGLTFAYPFVDYFTPSGSFTALIAAVNLGFLFGIPLIGIILFVVRILYRSRLSLPARIGLNSLWAINLISLFALMAFTGRQFQQSNQISVTSGLTFSGDTLHLELAGDSPHDPLHLGPLSLAENKLISEDININIRVSESNVFEISQEQAARGATMTEARERAEAIQFAPSLNGQTLTLPRSFTIEKGNKWRIQKVHLTIYVPVGKHIALGKGTRPYLHHFDLDQNVEHPWPYDDHIWKMEEEGLACPDYIDQNNRDSQLDYRDFSEIIIEGKIKVFIEKGEDYNVRLTGKEVYTEKIEVVKMDETLTVSTELTRTNSPVRLYITIPRLSSVALENTDDVKIQGFSEKNLLIKNDGRGDVKAFVNVDSLTIRQIGENQLDIRGKGYYLNASLSDQAQLDAEYFTVDMADYTAEGRSNAKLAVTKKINRRLTDGCRLSIEGEPEEVAY